MSIENINQMLSVMGISYCHLCVFVVNLVSIIAKLFTLHYAMVFSSGYTIPSLDYKLSYHLEGGKVVSVIDRCCPLSEAQEALRYFGEGYKKGKVIITV